MLAAFAVVLSLALTGLHLPAESQVDEPWLAWSVEESRARGRGRVTGRVGGFWGIRGLHTERAMNYELRVTWLTPEVIRAAARLRQLRDRATRDEAVAWVREAEGLADTIVMIELDPREGSGVIPLDWAAYLQPVGADPEAGYATKGVLLERGRQYPALAGVEKRDYDFDVFWVGFPLRGSSAATFMKDAQMAELVVRVQSSEGRVTLAIPPSIRSRLTP